LRSNLIRFFAVALALNTLPILVASSANATSSIAIGTTNYGAGVATNVGVSLSGFNQSQDYQVTVKFVNTATNVDTSNGTLAISDTATLTLISGYTSFSASKLGFTGSYARIAAALSTLTWNPSTASGDISMRIGIATKPGTNEFYDANTSRYYKYISTATSWTAARTAAEDTYLFGLRGYLAEINSEAENNFIADETSASNIWVGATEDSATATSYTGSSFNGTAGQSWIWEGALQTPLPSGSGQSAGTTNNSNNPAGVFSRWASGEPNNDLKPGRDCGVTNWGSKGFWNDLPCTYTTGYLIEFGGRSGETSTASTTTLTTTVVAQVPTEPAAPTLNSVTGGDKRLTIAFTAGNTGGATITDYEYSLNGGAYVAAGTTTSPLIITGLSGRTSYSVTLKARNSVGLGSASSSLSATTTDAAKDQAEREIKEANDAIAARAAQAAANRELAERVTIQPNPQSSNTGSANSATLSGVTDNVRIILAPNLNTTIPGLVSVRVSGKTIEVVAGDTFSGRLILPVTIADAGAITTINVPMIVNPKPVTTAATTPESRSNTNVNWTPSPNAISYQVLNNGVAVCTSTSTACSIPKILGPKSKLEVVALGNDGTISSQVIPAYISGKPIPVLDVKFALGSANISKGEVKKLQGFIKLMNEQGFTKVSISAFTDGVGGASGAKALSTARAKAVARYLDRFLDVSLATAGKGMAKDANGSKPDPNARKAQVAVN